MIPTMESAGVLVFMRINIEFCSILLWERIEKNCPLRAIGAVETHVNVDTMSKESFCWYLQSSKHLDKDKCTLSQRLQ